MKLTRQAFVLKTLDHVGRNQVQHALLERLLARGPAISFYTPSSPHLNFPDANDVKSEPSREGWTVTFTHKLETSTDHTNTNDLVTELATLYVDFKNFIEEANRAGTLVNALNTHGVIQGQMNEYLGGVPIGQWLLADALITGVSIDEAGMVNEQSRPTDIVICVDFSGYVR